MTGGTPGWQRLSRHWAALVGALLVAACATAALAAPWLAPHDPEQLIGPRLAPPSSQWPLGTDALGRDVLSRVIYGARLSLLGGAVSIAVALLIGGTAGAVAGYSGGTVDLLVMRGVDVLMAFPGILVALLVVVALSPGWSAVIVAVAVINVPMFCRQVRASVLVVRELDYVLASRAIGASHPRVLLCVVLPALRGPIVVLATLGLGTAILEVAGLSFLGIAGDISVPEWGTMLTMAKSGLSQSVWPALGPGMAITLCVLGFNLLGDALRDALDPRLRWRRG